MSGVGANVMDIELTNTATTLVIRLAGRFDFATRNQFMSSVEKSVAQATATEISVDMGRVDYIDSSALGMLLMLRDIAKKHNKVVALQNAQGQVRATIATAQLDRLFPMR